MADAGTNLLLDTHAFLWAVNEPDRLGRDARAALEDPERTLVVSAASAWELATKHRLGKLPEADAWLPAFAQQVVRLGAQPLPVSAHHALAAGGLDWDHRDPFDRMLGAQAVLEGLTLVTRDAAFARFPALRGEDALHVLW